MAGCWDTGAAETGMAVTGEALVELDGNVGGTGIGAAETGAAVTGLPVAGAVVNQKHGEQQKCYRSLLNRPFPLNLYSPADTG